ncbi:TetR/AcrR family transcriptional regulator, partial [Streptomyces sparsus]
ARRAALLDAAERVLSDSGHAALTLRAVAQEAGVRLGHLQYYFPARDDLVAHLLARVLRRSLDRLAETVPGLDGSAPAPLDRLVDLLLAEQEDPAAVRLFVELWALAARDETVAAVVRDFYREYADRLVTQLALHLGELGEAERRSRAEVFIALMEGTALLRSGVAGTAGAATDELVRRTALAVLLTGSAAPPAGSPG